MTSDTAVAPAGNIGARCFLSEIRQNDPTQ
jgi:hypothetical protein